MKQQSFLLDALAETTPDVILNAFAHDAELGYEYLTRKRIAVLCERKVSPTLIAKIENLVQSGVLEKSHFTMRNKAIGFQYRLVK